MIIEINLPPDDILADMFLASDIWQEARKKERYKRKRGLPDTIREWLLELYEIPEEARTPLVLEKATGRVTLFLRSRWGSKGAEKRKKMRLAEERKEKARQRKLVKQAKGLIRRFDTLHTAFKRPVLFGEGLPEQKRPPRKVA